MSDQTNESPANHDTQDTPTAWYGNIEDAEIREWAVKKNFPNPQEALKSYRNLEKMMGVDKNDILRLPKSGSIDELRPIWDRLGRPESPDGYELPIMEDDVIGFNDWFKNTVHDAGLTAAQAKQFAEKYDEFGKRVMEAEAKELELSRAAEVEALKKEWGHRFEENKALATAAVKSLANEEMFASIEQAIGPKAAMELFAKIGERTGEGKFVQSRNASDSLPVGKQAAQEELARMRQDKDIQAKLKSKDPSTIKRWQDLIRLSA